VIKHFADDVEYQALGFLEKNRDTVLEEQVESLKDCKGCPLLKMLLTQTSALLSVPQPTTRVKISPLKPSSVNIFLKSTFVFDFDCFFIKQQSPASTKQHRQSVGAQFRSSLTALMKTLNDTTPHYVRCIKPNDDKRSFQYDPARAVQQLRYFESFFLRCNQTIHFLIERAEFWRLFVYRQPDFHRVGYIKISS
jgi:myosin V